LPLEDLTTFIFKKPLHWFKMQGLKAWFEIANILLFY